MAACLELTTDLVPEFLSSIDTVFCDCDGVLWQGQHGVPGAAEALSKLRQKGKKIFFVTNNSTKSRKQYLKKFSTLGFEAYEEEIVCTASAAAAYLKHGLNYEGKIYLMGGPGMQEELELMGYQHVGSGPDPAEAYDLDKWAALPIDPEVKAVVVGFDEHISFNKLLKAATYLNDPDCVFIATNEDLRYPYAGKVIIPGTGVIVHAVRMAAQREPIVLGKPHKYLFESIMKVHPGIDPKRTVMIGDRMTTDILMGKNCGLKTLLVETGINTAEEAKEHQQSNSIERQRLVPDYYVKSMGVLGERIV